MKIVSGNLAAHFCKACKVSMGCGTCGETAAGCAKAVGQTGRDDDFAFSFQVEPGVKVQVFGKRDDCVRISIEGQPAKWLSSKSLCSGSNCYVAFKPKSSPSPVQPTRKQTPETDPPLLVFQETFASGQEAVGTALLLAGTGVWHVILSQCRSARTLVHRL